MPSAEYEPPIPSQDFSFDSFQDINSGLEKAAEQYPIISPTFGSFFNTQNTKKKFRNPPGLSFKTVTDLPKFTYSIQTTPANINDYFDFDNIESTTESVPRYTYKVVEPEPKQYSYTILSGNAADDQTPSATSGPCLNRTISTIIFTFRFPCNFVGNTFLTLVFCYQICSDLL